MVKKKVVKKPAKKIIKKRLTKKVSTKSKSTHDDIISEDKISRDVKLLVKETIAEEEKTQKLEKDLNKLDVGVKEELKNTKKEIDKIPNVKKKRSYGGIIVTSLIIVIIGLATWYILSLNSENEDLTTYNGFSLNQNGEVWEVKITQEWMPFFFHPKEVENIPVDKMALQEINNAGFLGNEIVLSIDPEAPGGRAIGQAIVEIQKIVTLPSFGAPMKNAFQHELEGYDNPVINCANRMNNQTVIEFRASEINQIIRESEGCIILNAKSSEDYKMVTDALAFRMLGIITN